MKLASLFKLALLSVTAPTLIGCGETQEEVLAYSSVEACIAGGEQDEAVCRSEYEKAQQLHNEVAPRYSSATQCYSDFGYDRCRRSSSSVWMPFMMGYMLAPRGGPGYISTQPLYRPSSDPNGYYTGGAGRIGRVSRSGRTTVAASQATRPAVRTRTVARGGFGARAAGRSAGS
jgi:uncharacterized protein YgiB involved in biofilm formation